MEVGVDAPSVVVTVDPGATVVDVGSVVGVAVEELEGSLVGEGRVVVAVGGVVMVDVVVEVVVVDEVVVVSGAGAGTTGVVAAVVGVVVATVATVVGLSDTSVPVTCMLK